MTLGGNAIDHSNLDDINDLSILFADDAFVNQSAADVISSSNQTVTVDYNGGSIIVTNGAIVGDDNVISASESLSGFDITGSSDFLVGESILINLNNQTYTALIQQDNSWTIQVPSADITALTEGINYTLTMNAVDIHGHAVREVRENIKLDRTRPINTLFIDEVITSIPIIFGQTTEAYDVVIKLDENNDGIYNDATYNIRSDNDGSWLLDLSTAVPTSGIAPIYTNIANDLGYQVTVTDNFGNTDIQTESSQKGTAALFISDSTVIEGTDSVRPMVFNVMRKGDLSTTATVDYAVNTQKSSAKSGGSIAGIDDDYSGTQSGTISFDVGESVKEIEFTVNGDYYKEVNQKIAIDLNNSLNASISKATGVGEIVEIDVSKMSGAFSLRDINHDEITNAIRVRRSSDNIQRDIGFNQYGDLDTEDLLRFVNGNDDGSAVSGASGHVVIWYDQSNEGRDLEQHVNIKQGTIVHNGEVLKMSNGDPSIVFNETDSADVFLNGNYDDIDSHNTPSATNEVTGSWMRTKDVGDTLISKSLEIYMTYQYSDISSGLQFNLSALGGNYDRIAPTAPYIDNSTYWDATKLTGGRLVENGIQSADVAQNLVFTANYNNSGSGQSAKNYIDAKQAIFVDGIMKDSDGDLNGSELILGDTWEFMGFSNESQYRVVSGRVNEFLVYTDPTGILPADPAVLHGNNDNNSFTYNGESVLKVIDGKYGFDVVHVQTSTLNSSNLEFNNIELINLSNNLTNELTLSDADIDNNSTVLSIILDENDDFMLNFNTYVTADTFDEKVVLGTKADDDIVMSIFDEMVIGRGGNDTFIYKSWSDSNVTTSHKIDKIDDFETGINKDSIDLTEFLNFNSNDDLSNYIKVSGGEIDNGNVVIELSKNGGNNFVSPDQTIHLLGLGSSQTIIDLDYLQQNNIII